MRLLFEQGLPRSTATVLAGEGWDVVHVSDSGMSRADDLEVLERAKLERRVCVTLDADFHALMATGAVSGSSVVRIRREGLDGQALAALLKKVWPGIEAALRDGALVTLTERSVRTRRLPIARD